MDPNLPDPTMAATWPQAIVMVALIMALSVVPAVIGYLNNKLAKAAKMTAEEAKDKAAETKDDTESIKRQFENNGGSTLKDALDRIEAEQRIQGAELRAQGDRLDEHLEEALKRDERITALEEKPVRRRRAVPKA